MEPIIQAISAKLNLPETAVRKGVGILLKFAKEKSVGTQFESFIAAIPGAESILADAPASESSGGGLLTGLLGNALGGAAGALGALQQAGIPLEKAGPMAAEFVEQARIVAGPEAVDALLKQIPALDALLGGRK